MSVRNVYGERQVAKNIILQPTPGDCALCVPWKRSQAKEVQEGSGELGCSSGGVTRDGIIAPRSIIF